MAAARSYDRSDLLEAAERPERKEPHLCGQGVCVGGDMPSDHQIVSISYARQLGARLLLVAEEAEAIQDLYLGGD